MPGVTDAHHHQNTPETRASPQRWIQTLTLYSTLRRTSAVEEEREEILPRAELQAALGWNWSSSTNHRCCVFPKLSAFQLVFPNIPHLCCWLGCTSKKREKMEALYSSPKSFLPPFLLLCRWYHLNWLFTHVPHEIVSSTAICTIRLLTKQLTKAKLQFNRGIKN